MLECFEAWHTASVELKEKGENPSHFILQLITSSGKASPCNGGISLYMFIISDCFCLVYSTQKQKNVYKNRTNLDDVTASM